ncbi:3-aminobutyryl-CoA aminotransferase [Rubinisphaera italica]|uniref:3-aminobutyryl-CoA aminotransferase n=2 Tax=Rubinisphaera italica TaxID=2527969 RepID=A0A5C5XCJ0_9PLAN|nr:3-aminobutyryl-CoA aminotransferase [Rubinisphaera italica]
MSLFDFVDPARWRIIDRDLDLFASKLGNFVPTDAFDAHAHWYDIRHLVDTGERGKSEDFEPEVGHSAMFQSMLRWMGDRATTEGLYFGYPTRAVDREAENRFVADQVNAHAGCRGLMLIAPQDNPAVVERVLDDDGFSGFKVYHVFAEREDTFKAEQHEFLPEWAWELAQQRGLWITMHMVLPRALSDSRNLEYIQTQCRRYPDANLVLAHAARGFNAGHTVEAIDGLRGIDNVYFDTSAICEPAALEAIIRATGTTHLMYGSDFPISELRGKALSAGDGFLWLYENSFDWDSWPHAQAELVGIESLLALQQACRTMCLNDDDVERIFSTNARSLLGIESTSTSVDPQEQYRRAKAVIPGGTQLLSKRPEMFAPNHWPAYYHSAIGCEVVDTSGKRYIDMSSNGILACILGFADPDVNEAVIRRVHLGSMATQQTFDEVRLAELLLEIHPWAEMARFTRSGGESMAVAVRIARSATGREKVAICGYHGWHDWYLAANLGDAGAEGLDGHLLPGLQPSGVPKSLRGTTLPFAYNRLDQLDTIIAQNRNDLAAIVMEPTRYTDPEPGFLEGVRERADRIGARLIFDEISIGWRLCLGGAHLKLGVTPDIAVFAKSISNGFAMAAVIGNDETMSAAQKSFISSAYWTEGIGPAAAVAAVSKMKRLEAVAKHQPLGAGRGLSSSRLGKTGTPATHLIDSTISEPFLDVPSHLRKIGTLFQEGWAKLGERHGVLVTVGGRPESVLIGFNYPDGNALMTLYTRRMLDYGFLAAGSFNPTMGHKPSHVEACLSAADEVFPELAETIDRGDVQTRIDGLEKHIMFSRLT